MMEIKEKSVPLTSSEWREERNSASSDLIREVVALSLNQQESERLFKMISSLENAAFSYGMTLALDKRR